MTGQILVIGDIGLCPNVHRSPGWAPSSQRKESMPSFTDLTSAPRLVREFGADAERHLEAAPLLALLRARQAFEALLANERDGRSLEAAGFRGEWQNILHGRSGLDLARERRAAAAALAFVFNRAKPETVQGAWAAPGYARRRDSFASLQLAHDELLRLVDSKEAPSEAKVSGRLTKLASRAVRLRQQGHLPAVEGDILAMQAALTALTVNNHAGAKPGEVDPSTHRLLARSAAAPGEPHRLWVEHEVRRGIALTNDFEFEAAWDLLERIVRPYREDAWLKDELMGRALGSTGQAAGFLARTLRDTDFVDRALECFSAAAQAFSLPDDVERQQVYRLHALCEAAILQMTDLQVPLVDALDALSPRIRGWLDGDREGPRVDYLLAAWLKAHHVLRRPVLWHSQIVQQWTDRPGRVTPDNLTHGPLLATGWLGVTTPEGKGVPQPIQTSIQEVSVSAGTPVLRFIATVFGAHFAWRSEAGIDLTKLSDGVPLTNGAQQWWSTVGWQGWIAEQCGPGGLGPISAVPFNHA